MRRKHEYDGLKRQARLYAQEEARNRIPARVQAAIDVTRLQSYNVTGLKKWTMQLRLRTGRTITAVTPYAVKEKARRRAARKVAHESRRRNR
jgi:hypothetical protein